MLMTAARYQRYSKARKLGVLAHDIGLLKEHATSMALKRLIAALVDRSEAADDALSEILSLETGIEDE